MKSLLQSLVRASVVAGLCLVVTLDAVAQDEMPGIVRISRPSAAAASSQQVMQTSFGHGHYQSAQVSGDCQNGSAYGQAYGQTGCPNCRPGCYRHPNSQAMVDYFRCKFGYFIPTGAGGAGVPLAGKYSRVYPQDPYYFDQRDGQAWGAQGYGVPLAVPLAPTVGHTYNYGWGIPSSRLTPVSRPAY